MPFRRRRTRRRRRVRPTALRAVRRLARFVDTELHEINFFNTSQIVDNTAQFFQQWAIGQGDETENRNGVQVSLRSLDMRYLLQRGNTDACFRMILFIDRQTNGGTPLVADLLAQVATGSDMIISPLNVENRKRFTILADRTHVLAIGMSENKCFRVKKRLTVKPRFDGTTAALLDVVSGMIWAMFVQANVGGAAQLALDIGTVTRFAP